MSGAELISILVDAVFSFLVYLAVILAIRGILQTLVGERFKRWTVRISVWIAVGIGLFLFISKALLIVVK